MILYNLTIIFHSKSLTYDQLFCLCTLFFSLSFSLFAFFSFNGAFVSHNKKF